MFLYKVTHQYTLDDHIERKAIGIYSTGQNAAEAVEGLKLKPGFCDTPNGFIIRKVFRLHKPKLIDQTFWSDGFVTYTDFTE